MSLLTNLIKTLIKSQDMEGKEIAEPYSPMTVENHLYQVC